MAGEDSQLGLFPSVWLHRTRSVEQPMPMFHLFPPFKISMNFMVYLFIYFESVCPVIQNSSKLSI